MSSFKRLVDIAKAEVGAVLEKAEKGVERVSERVTKGGGSRKLEEFSDDQLTAEIEKRRLEKEKREDESARKAADEARKAKEGGPAAAASAKAAEPEPGPPPPRPRSGKIVSNQLEQYYANLELEPGQDLETIKRAYRRLMRKYHPDKHAGDPTKYKAATELAQSLTKAYMELKKHLEG